MSDSKKPSHRYKPLRIGFDGTALFRRMDGVGRYTYNLIDSYAKSYPDDTIVVVGFMSDDTHMIERLLASHTNISFTAIPIPRKVYQGIFSRIVRIPLNIFVPALDYYVSTNFVQYPYLTNIRSLTVIHDLAYIRHPEWIERRNLSYLRKHVPKIVQSSETIAPSEFTKGEIESLLAPPNSVHIVSNGISALFTPPSNDARSNFILAVGTLEPRKNLERLLVAYASLPEKLQEEHPLVVIGKGGWGGVRPKPLKHVTYTGHIDDDELVRRYQTTKLFVFPSLYEGFGLPVIEAMATHAPVACSDIPPLRSLAKDYAVYFNPLDVASIRDTLYTALTAKSKVPAPTNVKLCTWDDSAKQLRKAILAVGNYSSNSAE